MEGGELKRRIPRLGYWKITYVEVTCATLTAIHKLNFKAAFTIKSVECAFND